MFMPLFELCVGCNGARDLTYDDGDKLAKVVRQQVSEDDNLSCPIKAICQMIENPARPNFALVSSHSKQGWQECPEMVNGPAINLHLGDSSCHCLVQLAGPADAGSILLLLCSARKSCCQANC